MNRRCTIVAVVTVAGTVLTGASNTLADGLTLEAGKPVALACDTKAVLVATNAANATNGSILLKLERGAKAAAGASEDGKWRPLVHAPMHVASLAAMQEKTCATGCPLSLSPGGDIQLWAPSPKSLDKLAPDELLLLAVVKTATLQLKASTFRGQQIEALESGMCRVEPGSPHAEQSKP
ncbi:MAG: hypothetical protein AB7E80_04730 [Hyphomicrobiaceae bacterium]